MSFEAIILVIVTWAPGQTADVQVWPVPRLQVCAEMARSFVAAEDEHNADQPPGAREHYSVSCELKNGGTIDEIKFQVPLDSGLVAR